VVNNVPLTRLFYCDPPGRTDPESLCNRGNSATEHNYIFFHDQEPIHLDVHRPLFDSVVTRNGDLRQTQGPKVSGIVTSEKNSEFVEQVCNIYGWKSYYYFFHGWAALDWYRGYNRSFLMPDPEHRQITQSFISPNRIVGGKRDHRVLLMYHLLENGKPQAHISFPKICPVEGVDVVTISEKFQDHYPDIKQRLANAKFPWNFAGEQNHPMHSCWLSLFEQCAQSLLYVVTETVASGRRLHLTEKIFKPICLQMPFVLSSTQGSLEYIRSYGFKTFAQFWDESYNDELDDQIRIEKVAKLLKEINQLSFKEKNDLFKSMIPVVRHNYEHFYSGRFESILWDEMTNMLQTIKKDYQAW
jgi:hypothetical protein